MANGGIGPGYGIFGVEGGLSDDLDLTLPDLHLESCDSECWIELVGEDAAARIIPICDWGCCSFSAVDCSTPEGNMLLFVDGTERADQQVTFARWFEDWVSGIEVGSAKYSRVRNRSKWLLRD